MEGRKTLQPNCTPEVNLEDMVRPLIKSYVMKIYTIKGMKFGQPKENTRNLLKHMLSQTVELISEFIKAKTRNSSNFMEEVVAAVDGIFPKIFIEVLKVPKNSHSDSCDTLKTLIIEEVTDKVKSGSKLISNRIDNMVFSASIMVYTFLCIRYNLPDKHNKEEAAPIPRKTEREERTVFEGAGNTSTTEESAEIKTESNINPLDEDTKDMDYEVITEQEISDFMDEKCAKKQSNREIYSVQREQTAVTRELDEVKKLIETPDVSLREDSSLEDQTSQLTPADSLGMTQSSESSESTTSETSETSGPGMCSFYISEFYKKLVDKLAKNVVLRIYTEAKMTCSRQNFDALKKQFYDVLWEETVKLDFYIPEEKFQQLDKAIYRDLLKLTRFPYFPEAHIMIERFHMSPVNIRLAESFRKHVSTKKPSRVKRFFSSMSKKIKELLFPSLPLEPKLSESLTVMEPEVVDKNSELVPVENMLAFLANDKSGEKIVELPKQRKFEYVILIQLCRLIRALHSRSRLKWTRESYELFFNQLYGPLYAYAKKMNFDIPLQRFKCLTNDVLHNIYALNSNPVFTLLANINGKLLSNIVLKFLIDRSELPLNMDSRETIYSNTLTSLLGCNAKYKILLDGRV